METTNPKLPSGISRVSIYPGDRGMMGGRTLAEALAFAEARIAEGKRVPLMLGAMRPGYLGREMVTLDDLRAVVRPWTCEAHNITTTSDCPECDAEMFAEWS